MEKEQTSDSEEMISHNPYDESSDEDQDNSLSTGPTLLKRLKILNLVRP